MSEQRTAHPYHMYDSIREQPARVASVLQSQLSLIERAAEAAAAKQRLIFAGIGTSLHAALLGELFLRHLSAGRARAQVEQSFEFVHYPLALSGDDAVIVASHRGWKNFSVETVHRAKAAGALTIAITGQEGGDGIRAAEFAVPTCEQEISFAHTKSFTTALAALALLAIGIAERRGWLTDARSAREELARVPVWMEQALAIESAARAVARDIAARSRLFFIGAGPSSVTAFEAALKVKETSYSPAEGFETEQFLHGPLAEADSRAAAVLLFSGAPSDTRTAELWAALGELGAFRIGISSAARESAMAANLAKAEPSAITAQAAHALQHLQLPAVPEWLSPFVNVIPIQLFAYFLALERTTNPDTGREDEPAHARAKKHFQL